MQDCEGHRARTAVQEWPWAQGHAGLPALLDSADSAVDNLVDFFNNIPALTMPTVNFSVPDDVKDAFNTTFEGQNKSAVIADLMREAVARAAAQKRGAAAYRRILKRRLSAPEVTADQVSASRSEGRS